MNILVTGGASGLGLTITKTLAKKIPGAFIYFTYFSSEETKALLEAEFSNVKGMKCNFREQADIAALQDFIKTGEIEILINNALTGLEKQYFHKLTAEDLTSAFKNDVLSVLLITGSFIQSARKRKSGKIITILTAALEQMPPIGWSIYTANKNYLLSMHRSWVAENRSFNITSNCVSPDFMATPLHKDVDERVIENIVDKHPLKKILTPEETAEVVLFLCGASVQLNGQNIILNAGQA